MPVTRIENAVVWTGVPLSSGGVVESDAVTFDTGGILALGDAARGLAADEVIDAAGGFVCCGFRDGHVHAIPGGFEHALAPVRDHATALGHRGRCRPVGPASIRRSSGSGVRGSTTRSPREASSWPPGSTPRSLTARS